MSAAYAVGDRVLVLASGDYRQPSTDATRRVPRGALGIVTDYLEGEPDEDYAGQVIDVLVRVGGGVRVWVDPDDLTRA